MIQNVIMFILFHYLLISLVTYDVKSLSIKTKGVLSIKVVYESPEGQGVIIVNEKTIEPVCISNRPFHSS